MPPAAGEPAAGADAERARVLRRDPDGRWYWRSGGCFDPDGGA
jgi:hypothetical protein